MSSGPKLTLKKLTLKKTPSQQAAPLSNGVQSNGSGEQLARAPLSSATPPVPSTAVAARTAAPGSVPRKLGLTLKGAAKSSTPQAPASTPAGPRISLKGAGSSGSHAAPTAATPQQAAVPASPAPASAPRRLALKGQSSRPPASAAATPATPAPPAAAPTPASAPKTAPPAVGGAGGAAGGFATPRPAAAASNAARAASMTPASAAGGSAQPAKKFGIKLKGSGSTPAGPARLASATPGSVPRPAATPGSSPASAPVKPRITLNKSRGRQNSMGLSQQLSMQSQHSLQPSAGHPPLQPVAYKQEAYKQEQEAAAAAQQASHYDFYSSGQAMQGYDASHAAASYGGMHGSSYPSHDYGSTAAGMDHMAAAGGADPAAAAGAGGVYGSGTDYTHGAAAHGGTDLAAAAAGMYGADHMYGMHEYDAAAAAATAVVDYSAQAYYQPQQKKGQKRGRASVVAHAAVAPVPAEPLGPRAKRPKPGQFRDTEEEDADEDFNPKAERARLAAARGSGGVATTRVKSKGPSGARASAGWQPARPVAPAARPAGGNRAAAAVKAAHRAAQNAAQRVHPHMAPPQRAGGGHMSAVVPTHRPRHMMPAGGGAAAGGAPRSPVLGEDAPMPSGAELAAMFAGSAAAQDAEAAVGLGLDHQGSDAMDAAVAAPAAPPAAAPGGRGRGRGGAAPRRSVEQVLQELHSQVEYVEETHPPTRETLTKLLAAVDKRDKYRFFGKPVTDDQAPGYSSIIKNPMDLSAMKAKVEGGGYATWGELMADIIQMCANAKVYNHPNTKPHKEADVIFKYSLKYVKSFKQGKFALRGAVAMAVRNANNPDGAAAAAAGGGGAAGTGGADAAGDAKGASAPSGPMTRNAKRGGRRPREEEEGQGKNKRQRGAPKFKPLAVSSDVHFASSTADGDSVRESFKGRPKMYAALWGGLADGASPEGVPFGGSGKPILRCVAGHAANLPPDTYLNSLSSAAPAAELDFEHLPPDTYLSSLSRFVSGAGSAVEKLVLKMLGNDLGSKLVPIPGVTPTQLPQQPGAHAAAAAAGHRLAHQQPHQQQQHVPGVVGAAAVQAPVQARMGAQGHGLPPQQQQLQHAGQQQSLAGLFGGGLAGVNITPAQLAQLQQNQLQQLRQQQNQLQQLRQQQGQGQQGAQQQQFVPGPGLLARAPGAIPAHQQ